MFDCIKKNCSQKKKTVLTKSVRKKPLMLTQPYHYQRIIKTIAFYMTYHISKFDKGRISRDFTKNLILAFCV